MLPRIWLGQQMQFDRLKRREFITLLGGAAVSPHSAHAQQRLPVIGLLSGFFPSGGAETLEAFRQGLSESGFVEHQNIGIEYHWAEVCWVGGRRFTGAVPLGVSLPPCARLRTRP